MFSRLTPAVKRLLILNVGFLLLGGFFGPGLERYLALYYVDSPYFLPTQFLTYMFLHAGFWHLLSNMLGLLVFGTLLERFWGSRRFLFFYIATGLGAGMIYAGVQFYRQQKMDTRIEAYIAAPSPQSFNAFLLEYNEQWRLHRITQGFMDLYDKQPSNPIYINQSVRDIQTIRDNRANIPLVGASGAVFGILMAFGLLFPNTEFMLLFPPIPVKAKYLVIFYASYELWQEITRSKDDNVAHFAHLGGLLIGFILVKYWQKKS